MSLFVTCPDFTSKKGNSLAEKKPHPSSAVGTCFRISHSLEFFRFDYYVCAYKKQLHPEYITWVQWDLGDGSGEKRVALTLKTHSGLRGIFPTGKAGRHHAPAWRPPKNRVMCGADFSCPETIHECALYPGHRGSNLRYL